MQCIHRPKGDRYLRIRYTHRHRSMVDRNFVQIHTFTCIHIPQIHISILHIHPPDPINHLCSRTGVWITQKYFTYHSVQILKSCSKDFKLQDPILRTRVYSKGFIPQHCWVVDFHLTKMVRRKCFVPGLYQPRKGESTGLALKYFYMIHRGWRMRQLHIQHTHTHHACTHTITCMHIRHERIHVHALHVHVQHGHTHHAHTHTFTHVHTLHIQILHVHIHTLHIHKHPFRYTNTYTNVMT